MKYPYTHPSREMDAPKLPLIHLLLALLFSSSCLHADEGDITIIEVKLGGYRFIPQEIQLNANQPAVLRLVNTDSVIPHNFTMKTNSEPAIDVDVIGGESVDVQLPPMPAGRYTFYCGNKLLFMKSHREKGMEGSLIINPE